MPIEIAALAATVVANYLLPYVKVGVEKIAEVATDKFSSVAAEHVTETTKKLWQKITSVFDSPDEKKTLERFEKDPERMAGSLEVILEEKLQQNEELARELEELVDARSPDGAGTGAQIMSATVAGIIDLRQARVSGGSFTAVRVEGGVGGGRRGVSELPDRVREDE
jgi:predicted RNase H-like nuclease (RuvC/YqgF family)